MTAVIDFSAGYTLAPDLVVFQRNDTTIQIGTETPRRVLITGVPPHATEVLTHLGDTDSLSAAIERLGGDTQHWEQLFRQLAADGLLERSDTDGIFPPHLTGEWMTLIHRVGRPAADRILTARADATVVIEGSGIVADIIGGLLDGAGIGRIHQWAGPGAVDAAVDPLAHVGAGGRVARRVRYHRPASQTRPTVTVLAGPQDPAPGRLAELVAAVVPHLPVQVTSARLIVGPLVLPGWSTCVNCIDRHRQDADADWPAVSAATALPPQPSAVLAHSAATLAAAQVLDLVDDMRRPVSVDATIEQTAGSGYPRRRAWSMHEACHCRNIAALPVPALGAPRATRTPEPAGI